MRITRVFTSQELSPGSRIELEPRASVHLLKVLRLDSDAVIALFNGNGLEYQARLQKADRHSLYADVGEPTREEMPAALNIRLYLGISKGERMDFAIQKAVELGVSAIHPLFTERCMVQLKNDRLEKRLAHWRGVIISACEQSNRCRLAELDSATHFSQAIQASSRSDYRLVLQHRADTRLQSLAKPQSGIDILVGPEGGLSPEELQLADAAGFKRIRLGPRVMRTETAPLAALAAIQTLWGDF